MEPWSLSDAFFSRDDVLRIWPDEEAMRIAEHKAFIAAIEAEGRFNGTADELRTTLARVKTLSTDRQEFTEAAQSAKTSAISELSTRLEHSVRCEAEVEEQRRQREEQIAATARAEAESEARCREEKAAREDESELQRIKQEDDARIAALQAELERRDAEQRAEHAERDRTSVDSEEEYEKVCTKPSFGLRAGRKTSPIRDNDLALIEDALAAAKWMPGSDVNALAMANELAKNVSGQSQPSKIDRLRKLISARVKSGASIQLRSSFDPASIQLRSRIDP